MTVDINQIKKVFSTLKRGDLMPKNINLNRLSARWFGVKLYTDLNSEQKHEISQILEQLNKIVGDNFKYNSLSSLDKPEFGFYNLSKEDFKTKFDNYKPIKDTNRDYARFLVDLLNYSIRSEERKIQFSRLSFITKGGSFNFEPLLHNRNTKFKAFSNKYGLKIRISGSYITPCKGSFESDLIFQDKLYFIIEDNVLRSRLIEIRDSIVRDFDFDDDVFGYCEEELPSDLLTEPETSDEERLKELTEDIKVLKSRLANCIKERELILKRLSK